MNQLTAKMIISAITACACCIVLFAQPTTLFADDAIVYLADFESEDFTPLIFFAGDNKHYKLVTNSSSQEQAHTGKSSWKVEINTFADNTLSYLYFASNLYRHEPKSGQQLEGWLKIGEATSPDIHVKLGISVTYPSGTETASMTNQIPLKIIQEEPNGWIKFQSADLLEFYTQLAHAKKWNAEGMFVNSWLLYIVGNDLKDKCVVVYIDDVVLK